jgi:hypothetical protein
MGEAVNRGASGKLDGRTRIGWLKHSSNRSRNRGVKRAIAKAGVARASARMVVAVVVARAVDVATTGAGIVGIAAATGDASRVRPRSIWRS